MNDNVSFVAGQEVMPNGTVYAATKHAVRTLCEGLWMDVTPYDIRTAVITPGTTAML